jgi:hypothetical protein
MIDSVPQIPRLYNRYYEIPHNPSSAFTEEISLWAIRGMSGDAVQDAVELMQMFSFLHRDGLSEKIFHQACTGLWNRDYSD